MLFVVDEASGVFSPHTLGYSREPEEHPLAVGLFPAYAGVIPRRTPIWTAVCSFPRTRGGDPPKAVEEPDDFYFSPHTRG